jgi:copper chaperone CopZ
MKNFMFVFVVSLTLSACNNDAKVVENSTNELAQEAETAEIHVNRVLTMEVEGMVCKMGCGGSIRKGLLAAEGVSEVKFDFEDDRVFNLAKISFDKNSVTADEMIKIVTELNDGQFKVGSVDSEAVFETKTIETSTTESSEESVVEVLSSHIEMPNLLDLFSGLLTH